MSDLLTRPKLGAPEVVYVSDTHVQAEAGKMPMSNMPVLLKKLLYPLVVSEASLHIVIMAAMCCLTHPFSHMHCWPSHLRL